MTNPIDTPALIDRLRELSLHSYAKDELAGCHLLSVAADAIEQLQAEQVKDLADVDLFRGMARRYMDERDALRAKVEKLEKALRDIGMGTAAADGADHCLARAAREALAEDK